MGGSSTTGGKSEFTRRELLRGIGAVGATAAGVALLGACQQPTSVGGDGAKVTTAPAGTPRRGGTLAVALSADPGDLATIAGVTATYAVTGQLYDPIVAYDPTKNEIVPALAESWQVSPDGMAYTFKLRRGVKFHDGTDFTAEAVALNFERFLKPDSPYYDKVGATFARAYFRGMDRVEVVDPSTVRYVFKELFADFLYLVVYGFFVSPAVIKQFPPTEVAKHPSGTGPFRFVERKEGRIALERFDGYWNGAPYLDKLLFRVYPDAAGASTALETGEVDFIAVVPIDEAVRLGGRYNVFRHSSQFAYMLYLNMRHPVTRDRRVRQALNYAVDREGLAKNLFRGQATVQRAVYTPTSPAWNTSLPPYPYDPERAKRLLADAGFGGGVTIRALQPTGVGALPLLAELAQSVQADLRKVGVNVTYDLVEYTAYLSQISKGLTTDHAFMFHSLGGNAMSNLEEFFGRRFLPPNGRNRSWYENDEAEKLFEAARGEMDFAKRKRLYQQAEEIIRDDAAVLFTVITPTQALHLPKVAGAGDRFAWVDFSRAWLMA